MNKKKFLLFLGIIVGVILLYQYPIQRLLAEKKFNEYIRAQGVDENNISRKKAFKNSIDGGYIIRVTYSDDPDYVYYYNYYPSTHMKNESIKFNRMILEVTDIKNSTVLDPPYEGKCKYPPLDE